MSPEVASRSTGPLDGLVPRLLHFGLVWSALLFVHELGHAASEWRLGGAVERITVGAGPRLWSGGIADTEVVLRLVPLVGFTRVGDSPEPEGAPDAWTRWRRESLTLLGGVTATLAVATAVAALVLAAERLRGTRWTWGRIVVADALVLSVFNFLPVPPLDGGRALLGTLTAWRGAPLPEQALFWVHVGGLGLALFPMMLWTRWTAHIDDAALRWAAPPIASGISLPPAVSGNDEVPAAPGSHRDLE